QALNNLGEAFAFKAAGIAGSNELLRQKYLDQAIQKYSGALEIRPGLWLTQYNRGVALAQESRFPEAMADFSAALKGNDEFAPAHFNLAHAADQLHQPAIACDHFAKALSLQSNQTTFETWLYFATHCARQLATDPNPHHRDGTLAHTLATQLADMTNHRRP